MRTVLMATTLAAALLVPAAALAQQPDLVVQSLTASVPDRDVTFTAQLCNTGAKDATTAFYFGKWNHRTGAPGCGMTPDTSLKQYNNLTGKSLAMGTCKTVVTTYSRAPTGTYNAWVMADHTCAVTESNEGNNYTGTSYTVNKPDFHITSITPTPNLYDRSIKLEANICNKGTTGLNEFHVGAWESAASAPGCTSVPDAKLKHWNALTAKSLEQNLCKKNVFIFKPVTPGTYTGWALADSDCVIGEESEGNNAKSVSYTMPSIDVYFKTFTVTVTGSTATFNAEICNKGASAIKDFEVGFFLDQAAAPSTSCGGTPDAKSVVNQNKLTGFSLKHLECRKVSASALAPAGTHTAWALADSTCTLPETLKSNNTQPYVYSASAMDAGADAGVDAAPPADAMTDLPYLPDGPGSCNKDGKCDPGESCPACLDCCKCNQPVKVSTSASLKAGFNALVDCPVVGGKAGAGASVKGSISASRSGCPDCKATVKASAEVSAVLDLCKQLTFTATGSGEYNMTKQHCLGCDPVTCEQKCLDTFCMTESFSGGAKLTISRFFGYEFDKTVGGKLKIGVQAKCGVTVAGSLGGKATVEETEDAGCAPCQQCEKTSGELTVGVKGTGGCGAKLIVGRWSPSIGCDDCAELGLDLTGGASVQKGLCGSKDCVTAKVGANASFGIGHCVQLLWFKADVSCKAKASGECKADTCSKGECKGNAELSCGVDSELGSCD